MKGQTTVQYAVLVAATISALLAMQVYLKRGISGRIRSAADSIGAQYAPKQVTADMTVKTKSDTTTSSTLVKDQPISATEKADVLVTKVKLNENTTEKTGSETVGELQSDIWK